MTAKEDFENAKVAALEAHEEHDKYYSQLAEANVLVNNCFRKYIIEEKILGQHPWGLAIQSPSHIRLYGSVDSDEWKSLSEFAETNYHCRFSLDEDDGYISFNDGEISISIDSKEQLKKLITKYGIKVEISEWSVKEKKRALETIQLIEEWEHFVKEVQ